jgi:hypothetical protein
MASTFPSYYSIFCPCARFDSRIVAEGKLPENRWKIGAKRPGSRQRHRPELSEVEVEVVGTEPCLKSACCGLRPHQGTKKSETGTWRGTVT